MDFSCSVLSDRIVTDICFPHGWSCCLLLVIQLWWAWRGRAWTVHVLVWGGADRLFEAGVHTLHNCGDSRGHWLFLRVVLHENTGHIIKKVQRQYFYVWNENWRPFNQTKQCWKCVRHKRTHAGQSHGIHRTASRTFIYASSGQSGWNTISFLSSICSQSLSCSSQVANISGHGKSVQAVNQNKVKITMNTPDITSKPKRWPLSTHGSEWLKTCKM